MKRKDLVTYFLKNAHQENSMEKKRLSSVSDIVLREQAHRIAESQIQVTGHPTQALFGYNGWGGNAVLQSKLPVPFFATRWPLCF